MRTWPAIDVGGLGEPDHLQAALCDYQVVAIDERASDSWRIFFDTDAERDRLRLIQADDMDIAADEATAS